MPATHLISVDLPAPLSPTSAITSPRRTSKSASASACTGPNAFETPRSSRMGVSVSATRVLYHGGDAPKGASGRVRSLLAVLLELALADVALLQEAVLEEER